MHFCHLLYYCYYCYHQNRLSECPNALHNRIPFTPNPLLDYLNVLGRSERQSKRKKDLHIEKRVRAGECFSMLLLQSGQKYATRSKKHLWHSLMLSMACLFPHVIWRPAETDCLNKRMKILDYVLLWDRKKNWWTHLEFRCGSNRWKEQVPGIWRTRNVP